jgi:hypothetical protein
MTPLEALSHLLRRVLVPRAAERFITIAATKKGQGKFIDALSHKFEEAIRPDVARTNAYERIWTRPCFVFTSPKDFGMACDTVGAAHDDLTSRDSWLIVVADGSAGIFRPEDNWANGETLLCR